MVVVVGASPPVLVDASVVPAVVSVAVVSPSLSLSLFPGPHPAETTSASNPLRRIAPRIRPR
jgi:hypothetical protein